MLILEEEEKAYRWLLGFSGSFHLRKEGGLTHHQAPLRSLTNIRILPKNIQLIFQEESRIVAKFAIHNRTKPTGTAVLVLVGRIGDVEPDICPFDVHVAGTDATAVEVSVLKDIHHRIGENQGDIETMGFRNRLHGGRLHRVKGPRGRGRRGW